MMGPARLPRGILARVFLRSFLLQASWNFERLQSLGFLYALSPALRFLYGGDELKAAGKRHLQYFNTHPFMASPVMGTVLDLEVGRSRGEVRDMEVEDFRRMVMAPYAAMGDAFFWGGVRPLAAVAALFFAFEGSLWAPLVYLAVFNLPHIWVRVFGLLQGYFLGLRMTETVQHFRLPDLAVRCKQIAVILFGGLSAYLAFSFFKGEGLAEGWAVIIAPLVILSSWLVRKGISLLLLVLAAATLLVVSAQIC